MPHVTIDTERLAYTETGSGDPLVLVHGSASDCRTWHLQQAPFAAHFRTIAYSRRYHWPNHPIQDDGDYAMLQHVDDLKTLLYALDAGPAHLVGHSYGAFLCLLLAIQKPALVRTLVLAEPPVVTLFVSNTPTPGELLKLLLTRPRTAAAVIKFGAKGVAPAVKAFRRGDTETAIRTFGDAVFGTGGYDRLPANSKVQVHDNLTTVKAELSGSGFAPLAAEQVRTVRVPTLLVTGGKSIPLFHHLTDRLEELLPDVERIEVPGASHMMHADNPSAYNAAVLAFIRKRYQAR